MTEEAVLFSIGHTFLKSRATAVTELALSVTHLPHLRSEKSGSCENLKVHLASYRERQFFRYPGHKGL